MQLGHRADRDGLFGALSLADGMPEQLEMMQACPVFGERKRGEAEREDLSGNLIVQLGTATEELNRKWYDNTGRHVKDIQRRVKHSAIPWMAATLDGVVGESGPCLNPSSCCPGRSPKRPRQKYMAQLKHNMWVTHLRGSVLSIITGGGKWVEITIPMDPLYLSVLVSAEKKFWRCAIR